MSEVNEAVEQPEVAVPAQDEVSGESSGGGDPTGVVVESSEDQTETPGVSEDTGEGEENPEGEVV